MKHATLLRAPSHEDGTLGRLVGRGLDLATIELMWRGNEARVSCIPTGRYLVEPRTSSRFRSHAIVLDPEGSHVLEDGEGRKRTWILFHSGNVAGQKALGLRSHSQGCILPGLRVGKLHGQAAVLASREAMRRLRSWMDGRSFELDVEWD